MTSILHVRCGMGKWVCLWFTPAPALVKTEDGATGGKRKGRKLKRFTVFLPMNTRSA